MDGNRLAWIPLASNPKLITQPSECFIQQTSLFVVPPFLFLANNIAIFAIFLSFSFANRLTNIKENHKFQKDGKEGHRVEDPALGLRHIVGEIKDKHALKYDSLI